MQNNALAKMAQKAAPQVISAIKDASAKTGVNFAYMVQQASAESSFNPDAKAKTSSASGLYQFIESTWLSMVKKHGEKYGLGDLAEKISDKGKVSDRATRKEILNLRFDPKIASSMAAEFASENEQFLETHWGGDVGSTELYFAHFLGAGQASAFLKARDDNPMTQAALLFPKAAAANRNVFYDAQTGRAKTLDEVYTFFDRKFAIEDGTLPSLPAAQDSVVAMVKPERKPAPQTLDFAGNTAGIAADLLADVSDEKPAIESSVFVRNLRNLEQASARTGLYSPLASSALVGNPAQLMMLSQMNLPLTSKAKLF